MKKSVILGYVKLPEETRKRKAIAYIKLENTDGRYKLTMWGEIEGYVFGQCREEIKKHMVDPLPVYYRAIEIWERYHLNYLHEGTPRQEEIVKKLNLREYKKICKALKKEGLYNDNGHIYGGKWLYEPIPERVLNEIFNW